MLFFVRDEEAPNYVPNYQVLTREIRGSYSPY